MPPIDIRQLVSETVHDAGLAYYAKRGNVEAMTARLADGACASSLANVLHYDPSLLLHALEATAGLTLPLQENALAILGAIEDHHKSGQRDLIAVWQARCAATSALHSITWDVAK